MSIAMARGNIFKLRRSGILWFIGSQIPTKDPGQPAKELAATNRASGVPFSRLRMRKNLGSSDLKFERPTFVIPLAFPFEIGKESS